MVKNDCIAVCIRVLGSWLFTMAVKRLVRRFKMRDRLICGASGLVGFGGGGGGGAWPVVAAAYERDWGFIVVVGGGGGGVKD